MDMMTAAFLSIAIVTVSVTIIMAAVGAVARRKLATAPATPARTPRHFRQQATRVAGMPLSARRLHAQHLPTLQRARILRARTTCPEFTRSRRREWRQHSV
jgi:hypothetical protein